MRVESFGQSRPQEGRRPNENQDAFLIGSAPVPWAALLDGAGNAQAVARRAGSLLERWFREVSLGQLLREEAWIGVARRIDLALRGGPETTLVVAAVVGGQAIGLSVGDSRAYHVPLEGATRLVTEASSKSRLGSGEIEPLIFHIELQPRDVLVLLSDGAWGPLGHAGVDRSVRSGLSRSFAETPGLALDAASRHGRADDMTAVALRVLAARA